MTRNKNYRGSSRVTHPRNVTDAHLVETRKNGKRIDAQLNKIEQHQLETRFGKHPQLRFDYTDNVFSLRGNWQSRISVIKLFFPFIVNKKKCKQFEELVNQAFETVFLVKKKKEKKGV